MKTIAGYQFRIITDNGDTHEWWREHHIESPLYATEELAKKALLEYKKSKLQKAKADIQDYVDFQYQFEVKHNRSINKFLGDCQIALYASYKEIINMTRTAEIIPVFVYSEVTTDYVEYKVAN